MNAKISVSFICVGTIKYLLLYNLHDCTFNNKLLIILKTYVHYLRHKFINQNQNVKTGFNIFIKIKNTDRWKDKVFFRLFCFRNSLFFIYVYFQEMLNVSSEHSFKYFTLYLEIRNELAIVN